jgi:hypothetical protein
MAESYADEQRRRNGLTPAGYYVDEVAGYAEETAAERTQRLIAEAGLAPGTFVTAELIRTVFHTERDDLPDLVLTVAVDSTEAESALGRLAAAFDLRCPHDLLTDMCHHCKEIDRA